MQDVKRWVLYCLMCICLMSCVRAGEQLDNPKYYSTIKGIIQKIEILNRQDFLGSDYTIIHFYDGRVIKLPSSLNGQIVTIGKCHTVYYDRERPHFIRAIKEGGCE